MLYTIGRVAVHTPESESKTSAIVTKQMISPIMPKMRQHRHSEHPVCGYEHAWAGGCCVRASVRGHARTRMCMRV